MENITGGGYARPESIKLALRMAEWDDKDEVWSGEEDDDDRRSCSGGNKEATRGRSCSPLTTGGYRSLALPGPDRGAGRKKVIAEGKQDSIPSGEYTYRPCGSP